jgi:hypothetical protein
MANPLAYWASSSGEKFYNIDQLVDGQFIGPATYTEAATGTGKI